jgi:hypothetical protein
VVFPESPENNCSMQLVSERNSLIKFFMDLFDVAIFYNGLA